MVAAGTAQLGRATEILLLWALVVFVFFQCMATKYITYTYPLLFPASLLLGSMIAKHTDCADGGYMFFVGGGFAVLLGGAWFAVSHQLIASELLFLLPLALIVGVMLDYNLRLVTGERVCSVATMSVMFYIALIFSIAVPLSEQRSAKNLGQMLTAEMCRRLVCMEHIPLPLFFTATVKLSS